MTPLDPFADLPPELLKKMLDQNFVNFRSSFFRAAGPIPESGPRPTSYTFEPEPGDLTGFEENGVWRPITFKIEHEYDVTFGNPFFAQDYARAETEENKRRFTSKIIGIGFNPITAKKWLEPTYKVPDGESDGMVFGRPTIIRAYIPEDVVLLTFKNGSVSMIKIIEAENG
jgi:hypothetical protein